jgi:hypothetical protein
MSLGSPGSLTLKLNGLMASLRQRTLTLLEPSYGPAYFANGQIIVNISGEAPPGPIPALVWVTVTDQDGTVIATSAQVAMGASVTLPLTASGSTQFAAIETYTLAIYFAWGSQTVDGPTETIEGTQLPATAGTTWDVSAPEFAIPGKS